MLTDSPTQNVTSGMMVQDSGSRSSEAFGHDKANQGSRANILLQKFESEAIEKAKKIEAKLSQNEPESMDLYLEALEDLSNANPAFANAISLIKAGIQKKAPKVAEAPKPAVAKEETKTEA